MLELSAAQVRALRVRAQFLASTAPEDDLIAVVRRLCGGQAQLSQAMLLALRARVPGLTVAAVEAAINHRQLVRTWLMRGTLHLLPAQDVRWIAGLLSPDFIAKTRKRREQLGLDEATAARGLELLRAILSEEPLTRGEIVKALAERGLTLERRSQAPIHLIGLAAHQGIACLAADGAGGESTYVALDQWIAPSEPLTRVVALTRLAARYLDGYAPADPPDFAAWSGLTVTDAKNAFKLLAAAGELVPCRLGKRGLWLPTALTESLKPSQTTASVRLLPAFDTYVLGYKDRDLVVVPEHQGEVYHGGQTVPVVCVDGAAAGVWRYRRQGKRLQITVHAFAGFDPSTKQQIAAEADDIGRFWGSPVSVMYSESPL